MINNKLLHEHLREFALTHGWNKKGMLDAWRYRISSLTGQEAECLADEIERCYIPIPVDENGELWKIGDACIAYGHETEVCGYGKYGGVFVFDEDKSAYNVIHPHRLKRLDSKVLDADGVPIKIGDIVYSVRNGDRGIVDFIEQSTFDAKKLYVGCVNDNGDYVFSTYSTNVSHTPDTQKKIDADKKRTIVSYWKCGSKECDECPVSIYGKNPMEFYETRSCEVAQGLDIARRQAALDARGKED